MARRRTTPPLPKAGAVPVATTRPPRMRPRLMQGLVTEGFGRAPRRPTRPNRIPHSPPRAAWTPSPSRASRRARTATRSTALCGRTRRTRNVPSSCRPAARSTWPAAPLSRTVAEIRSLVVSEDARSTGIGRRMIDALLARANAAGFERVCAFTHAPSYFVQLGFSIVPHDWLPEKISTNCGTCAQFRTCGQWAVMLPLRRVLHG